MGDAPALRMVLASNLGAKTTLNLMPMKTKFLNLLRARFLWCKIGKVTFYILRTIVLIRFLGNHMIRMLMFITMLLFMQMEHLALGVLPHMLKLLRCLK
jgi:hypothetical protein